MQKLSERKSESFVLFIKLFLMLKVYADVTYAK